MGESFRAIYAPDNEPYAGPLQVQVIGYRQTQHGLIDVPGGMDSHFLYFAYEPIRLGAVRTEPYALVIAPAGTPICQGRERGAWRRSWVRCRGPRLLEWLDRFGLAANRPLAFVSPSLNERYLLALHEELHHPRGPDPTAVEELFALWLQSVARAVAPDTPGEGTVPARLRAARQYIQTHYSAALTLAEVARQACLSRPHLCREFRRHYGVSPIDYAIDLRLQDAAELLADVNLNVTQVAERCGFRDVFYFSRLFKRRLGVSPRAYRTAGVSTPEEM